MPDYCSNIYLQKQTGVLSENVDNLKPKSAQEQLPVFIWQNDRFVQNVAKQKDFIE